MTLSRPSQCGLDSSGFGPWILTSGHKQTNPFLIGLNTLARSTHVVGTLPSNLAFAEKPCKEQARNGTILLSSKIALIEPLLVGEEAACEFRRFARPSGTALSNKGGPDQNP